MNENQTDRIIHMEQIMDRTSAAVRTVNEALDRFEAMQKELDDLIRYYESPQWMADFEADSAGLIPKDLKRGVLSEDGVYDLLEEIRELRERLQQNANRK